jgi:predicted dehydrogenase
MPLRLGLVTCAHVHTTAYVSSMAQNPDAEISGIWDHDAQRGNTYAAKHALRVFETYEQLLAASDAVAIVSENATHATYAQQAAEAGKHIICEKPLVIDVADGEKLVETCRAKGLLLMTAFPCRFSPAWAELKRKVGSGEIGQIQAICATNRGRCPGGWFVMKELSGGGSMIDHVVHVADLLRDLLGSEPIRVQAQTGNNTYGKDWEDTAMLTLEYPGGVFATLDSSWSIPQSYKTWGDVTMNVVGEKGVLEMDMFGQAVQVYGKGTPPHAEAGFGSDLDALMFSEFIDACIHNRQPLTSGEDGLAAAKVALAGYRSAASGQPVDVR